MDKSLEEFLLENFRTLEEWQHKMTQKNALSILIFKKGENKNALLLNRKFNLHKTGNEI